MFKDKDGFRIHDVPLVLDDENNLGYCVVKYHGMQFRFSQELRYSFDTTSEFIDYIIEDLDERIEDELEYQSV